jgi:CheY-like chemotaxis protein
MATCDHRKLRVLIVDNDQDNADSLGMLVGLWGHEARVVYGGAAALALAPGFQPDVMFLDLSMPLMDGNELARRVRQLVGRADVLLVAITGHGYERDYRDAKAAGFDHLLLKPVELDVLIALLAQEKAKRCPAGSVA